MQAITSHVINDMIFDVKSRKSSWLFFWVILIFMLLWAIRVSGQISVRVTGTYILYVALCMSYGRSFYGVLSFPAINKVKMVFQFLTGYFIFNSLFFFLTLVSPFGIYANFMGLTALALLLAFFGTKQDPYFDEHQEWPANLLCIILSGAGATIWCLDAQASTILNEQSAVFRAWQDIFFHVRQISVFQQAHGINTIIDIKMAGMPASIYHYGSYISAAAISAVAGIAAIDIYSSFLLPFGIFLTGLAAFVLVGSIWGAWPALAATVAIVLMPDAYQQGFGNRYLSYNFLAQVNLGMLYGIACAALSWVFILDGCSRGKYKAIILGYSFMVITLFYKAHIFVANSFLVLIYPCLFFSGLKTRWRLAIGIIFTGVFVFIVKLSQNYESIPVLRLDGSGAGGYVVDLIHSYDPGILKDFFDYVFLQQNYSKPISGLLAAVMILVSTFGLWIAVMPIVGVLTRSRLSSAVLYFPVVIILNYLIMSLGLALDTHGIGTRDELLNRPLVWAYFAVAAWTIGGGYHLLFGNGLSRSKAGQICLAVMVCLTLCGTVFFARNLQIFPVWKGFAKYEDFNSVPLCLIKASDFIRDNSHINEVIQDSENDSHFTITALSERQAFAVNSMFSVNQALQDRLNDLKNFKNLKDPEEINAYAKKQNISWYILRPESVVSWSKAFLEQPVFDCNGYRIYHFLD